MPRPRPPLRLVPLLEEEFETPSLPVVERTRPIGAPASPVDPTRRLANPSARPAEVLAARPAEVLAGPAAKPSVLAAVDATAVSIIESDRSAWHSATEARRPGPPVIDPVEPSRRWVAAAGCSGPSGIGPARPSVVMAGVAAPVGTLLVRPRSDPRRGAVRAAPGPSQLRARRAAAGPVGKPVDLSQRPVGVAGSAVRVHRHARPPIRLTRRGRVVLALTLAVLATALVAGLVALAPSTSQAAAPPRPLVAVVVHPGDTLWSIAARGHPSGSVLAAMDEIERINHMPDATVYVGQQLLVPAPS